MRYRRYEHAPPGVLTGSATGVSASGATLGGQVNPNARASSYHFEYGTTTSYGSSTGPQTAPPGLAATPVGGVVGALAPGATYHFRLVASNADGTTVGADQTFTTVGARGASGAPRFLSASVHPRVFAVRRARRAATRPRPPIGTTIRFTLTAAGQVRFTIEQMLPGRRVGRSCVAQSTRNHRHTACTLLGQPRAFAVDATAGPNSTRFTGRIGGRALKPGRYRLTLLATDAIGQRSAPAMLTFRVAASR